MRREWRERRDLAGEPRCASIYSPDHLQENVQEATNGATLKVRLGLWLVADLFGLWDWMRIRMREGVVELDGGKEQTDLPTV